MLNFDPVAAEIVSGVWGTQLLSTASASWQHYCTASIVVGVSQTLRRWTEGATYVRHGDHHVGHWPTFLVNDFIAQITTDTASSFTYCGTEVPETLTLNATTVVLTFVSDYAVTETGFKIQFKVQSAESTGTKTISNHITLRFVNSARAISANINGSYSFLHCMKNIIYQNGWAYYSMLLAYWEYIKKNLKSPHSRSHRPLQQHSTYDL